VLYLSARNSERAWGRREIRHSSLFLGNAPHEAAASELVQSAELTVFNYYQHRNVRQWMHQRALSKKPWCFWGERLGFRFRLAGAVYRRWALRDLASSSAPVWGIGSWAVESYKAEFGSGQRRYENLPYFSDLSRFFRSAKVSRYSGAERVFLFSGSLIKRKGIDLLATAFIRLAERQANARLCVMGEGPLLPELRDRLSPVASRVEFVGFRDWDNLPEIYAKAHFLCAPSRHDGWGLVVPEGLAAGIPVISTLRTGAALELIRTGSNGWLIPASDEEALFEVMSQAASLPLAEYAEMSAHALESVSTHGLTCGAIRFVTACQAAISNWRS
jgi:glycosyltransferase involved in cell wall biosynthesis